MNNKESLTEVLKKEGLRYTLQRQSVWDEIKRSKKHRNAEEIYQALRGKNIGVSRATVYRTIDVLTKNKMVQKMDVGDGKSLYEAQLDNDHHDHMICVDSGKIIEFFDEELELLQDKIAKKYGYKVVRHVHQLFVKRII
jgi:Fur family ferric uptake transcriptional regulator